MTNMVFGAETASTSGEDGRSRWSLRHGRGKNPVCKDQGGLLSGDTFLKSKTLKTVEERLKENNQKGKSTL